MRLLLDTRAFLWWRDDSRRLGPDVRQAIATAAPCFVSAASGWEVALKMRAGKIRLPGPFADAVTESRMDPLPVTLLHAAAAAELPDYHADPFDRLLVAQARLEGLTLVSHDRRLEPYKIPILWIGQSRP